MTRNPRRITLDETVFDALELMEGHAITVLPVVDNDNKPAGMIHLHDLVQMGILHQPPAGTARKRSGARSAGTKTGKDKTKTGKKPPARRKAKS